MAYENQLFIGKLTSATPAYDNLVAINGDTTSGQNTITNASALNATYDINLLRIGQTINTISSGFAADVTITNIAGSTITVSAAANATQTGGIFTADTPAGTYFINSASFSDPQNVLTVNNITGSDDSDYDAALTPKYAIIGSASPSLGGSLITGKFHLYELSEVTYRDIGTAGISAFVKWAEQGVESDSGDFLYVASNQSIAIGALSTTSSNVTIFGDDVITGLSAGADVAGYQIALPSIIDQAVTGSGGGDAFPYTGSAQITGSNGLTGNVFGLTGSFDTLLNTNENFLISNAAAPTQSLFNINQEGVATFRARVGADGAPSAIVGGLYFTTSSAFIGID